MKGSLPMMIARRLFVVPLGNNNHGKSTIMNALLSQGLGGPSPGKKGVRTLTSPGGRKINAYIFGRSYQETEKPKHKSVAEALKENDPDWKKRELIIFPSHVSRSETDVEEMISLAHGAGFDIICAAAVLDADKRSRLADVWQAGWDERWTVPNPDRRHKENQTAQLEALGRDLWMRICKALAP
jgi:hypothetical protein